MRQVKYILILWLVTAAALLAACTAPTGGTCDQDGLCIDLELQDPIEREQPVSVTVTVTSREELSGLLVNLWFSDPDILVAGENEWEVTLGAGESAQFLTAIEFPSRDGNYQVHAGVLHPAGRVVQETVPVRITTAGGTVYPETEVTPGIPEPAEPVTPTVAIVYGPFELSDAVVTPHPGSLLQEPGRAYAATSHDSIAFEDVAEWSSNQQPRPPTPLREPYPRQPGSGEVTVQGSLHYYDRDNDYVPARSMKVYLYDDDGAPGFDESDDLLTTTVTSPQGTFRFAPQPNRDEDAAEAPQSEQRLDLYVIWETADPTSGQRVTNFSDWAYKFTSTTRENVPDGVVSFNNQIPDDADGAPALWIFQDMVRAWEYVRNIADSDPGPASARWKRDTDSFFPCPGSCFWPYPPINGMFIDRAGQDSPDVVLHELGHHYMYNATGAWWWSDVDDMLACRNHGIREQESSLCAWAEGWATFHALAINGDACFDWDNSPCAGLTIDLESPTWDTLNWDEGDEVEGRITGALYDLFDSAEDGKDRANFGYTAVWNLVSAPSPKNAFSDFWSAWRASSHDNHLAVQAIFQNTINYNQPPIMALPDLTVLEGFSYHDAVDLWAYTTDSESDGWELEWEIDTISDWHCSNVHINQQDRVNVVIPYPGWHDGCNVTVSVTDGLSKVKDTFRVQVVPVTARVYLPLTVSP